MKIVYDPTKDRANQVKHGVSLAEVARFEWRNAVIWTDDRIDYGEQRLIAIGYIALRLYVVVYTERNDLKRIISLRKANAREVKSYAKT